MTAMLGEEIVSEQKAYYRARAPEYDRWFFRQGRYDRGDQATASWFREVQQVRDVLASMPLGGADVLELAPGTGIWTEQLVYLGATVTAVDASAEMIDENRRRIGVRSGAVTYLKADLFEWCPTRTWDAVVFCFWISHVPVAALDQFLCSVAGMVRQGGSIFFVDGLPEPSGTAADHQLPDPGEETMTRRLDDGREFRIIKNYWPDDDLASRFTAAGLEMSIQRTATYFQYGVGTRHDDSSNP